MSDAWWTHPMCKFFKFLHLCFSIRVTWFHDVSNLKGPIKYWKMLCTCIWILAIFTVFTVFTFLKIQSTVKNIYLILLTWKPGKLTWVKAYVSFLDHLLSVCNIFTLFSSSPEPLDQFQPNLIGTKHPLVKGIQLAQINVHAFSKGR